jgi:hypothetical protein
MTDIPIPGKLKPFTPRQHVADVADISGAASETLAGLDRQTIIIEGINTSSTATGVRVGTCASAGAYWTYPSDIGCAVALSVVPTQLQRLQTQYILDCYYRPDKAPAAKLALDLYKLL